MNSIAQELGIKDYFNIEGLACSPNYIAKDKFQNISMEYRSLFSQEMIHNNILMPWTALSTAHGDQELEMTLTAVRNALKVYSQALESGVDKYLKGPVIKPVFRAKN